MLCGIDRPQHNCLSRKSLGARDLVEFEYDRYVSALVRTDLAVLCQILRQLPRQSGVAGRGELQQPLLVGIRQLQLLDKLAQ